MSFLCPCVLSNFIVAVRDEKFACYTFRLLSLWLHLCEDDRKDNDLRHACATLRFASSFPVFAYHRAFHSYSYCYFVCFVRGKKYELFCATKTYTGQKIPLRIRLFIIFYIFLVINSHRKFLLIK